MENKKISLVIPCFNESYEVLDNLVREITKLEIQLRESIEIEKILIDDGSTSSIYDLIANEIPPNSNWNFIKFSRNFGKEAAIRAGLDFATGDAVIPIDADLQDPINLIPKMIEMWQELQVPIVLAKRIDRSSDTFLKRVTANSFYKLISKIGETEISSNVGDFRLLDRKVVNAIVNLKEKNLFMKGIYSWPGYNFVTIEYTRPARVIGNTNFPYRKLIKLALDGIVSFSSLPIRIWSWVGATIAFISVSYSVALVVLKTMGKIDIPGYTSLVVISLLSLSLNLICFGIFGEYLSRMFIEIKNRPPYLIDKIDKIK